MVLYDHTRRIIAITIQEVLRLVIVLIRVYGLLSVW
jgi:hypothetical protein